MTRVGSMSEVALHLVDQGVDVVVDRNAHAHTAIHPVTVGAEVRRPRLPGVLEVRVEHPHLQGAARHGVTAYRPDQTGDVLGLEVLAEDSRHEVVAQDEQRGIVELVAVERVGRRYALAPAHALVRGHLEEQHVTLALGAERRAERPHQGHRDLVGDDVLDPHAPTSIT